MIKQFHKSIDELEIPDDARVIDIGGASAPFNRADVILDLISEDRIEWHQAKGKGESRMKEFVQHDICSREPLPFKDKEFDFSFCSHVLEDIRDPIWACSEIIRVSKAGYIEVPSKLYEMTFGIDDRNLSGAAHHRWLTELVDNELNFTFKFSYVHEKCINKNRKKLPVSHEDMKLKLVWSDDFKFKENWLDSGKEYFEYFLGHEITEKEMWKYFRKTSPHSFLGRWARYIKKTVL